MAYVEKMGLEGVVGHTWALQRLGMALQRGTLAQSHLFVGADHIGKTTLALALARALLMQGSPDPKRVSHLVGMARHPDLLHVKPDEGSIKVEPIRELLHTLALAPVESGFRVAIIERADLMSDSAKNALLKTLEEPNPRVVIILTAPNVEGVLPTIASRCQVLVLRHVPTDEILRAVQLRGAADSEALAHAARGRVGWALEAAIDPALQTWAHEVRQSFSSILRAGRTDRFALVEVLVKQFGSEIDARLEVWMLVLRDAVLSGDMPADVAQAALKALRLARRRIDANANPRLALDALMLSLPTLKA